MNSPPSPLLNGPCLNCGEILTGSYCRACGQKADTRRVTMHGLLHEIPHAILHLDRGSFATLRGLARRPGQVINGWLEGQRARWFNPFTLVMVLGGLGALLYGNYPFRFHAPEGSISAADLEAYARFSRLSLRFFTLYWLAMLPAFALITWLSFAGVGPARRRGYGEHLVLNAFILGFVLFLAVCSFPLLVLTNDRPEFLWVYVITGAIYFLYQAVALFLVFAEPERRFGTLLRTSVAVLLYFVLTAIGPQLVFWKLYLGR